MPIERKKNGDMSAVVTLDALLSNPAVYALSKEEATSILEEMITTVNSEWRDAMRATRVPENVIHSMEPAFSLGVKLLTALKQ